MSWRQGLKKLHVYEIAQHMIQGKIYRSEGPEREDIQLLTLQGSNAWPRVASRTQRIE